MLCIHIRDIKVNDDHKSSQVIFLIRSSWTFFRQYPSLKPHILFHSNGLAIWHSLPDITHINVNNSLKSAIMNLIEMFQAMSLSETAHLFYS